MELKSHKKYGEFINEHFVNVYDKADMIKYAKEIWDMLIASYANVPGGFLSATSPEHLAKKLGFMKLIRRDGKIVAGHLYKDKHGRKAIALFTDGTPLGKKEIRGLLSDDMRLGRAWLEVSGAAEHIIAKSGEKPVPNTRAAELTGKEIISLNPDGVHYTRLIGGFEHEKIIFGYPK